MYVALTNQPKRESVVQQKKSCDNSFCCFNLKGLKIDQMVEMLLKRS